MAIHIACDGDEGHVMRPDCPGAPPPGMHPKS